MDHSPAYINDSMSHFFYASIITHSLIFLIMRRICFFKIKKVRKNTSFFESNKLVTILTIIIFTYSIKKVLNV